jgi:hypothetical protein
MPIMLQRQTRSKTGEGLEMAMIDAIERWKQGKYITGLQYREEVTK